MKDSHEKWNRLESWIPGTEFNPRRHELSPQVINYSYFYSTKIWGRDSIRKPPNSCKLSPRIWQYSAWNKCRLFRSSFCIATKINFNEQWYKEFQELITYFSLIRHRPHTKDLLQQLYVATGTSLRSLSLATKGGMHIQTHRSMGGIYELRRWDWLSCHDICI